MPNCKPRQAPPTALSNNLLKASIMMINNNGDNKYPSQSLEIWKKPLGLPFTKTQNQTMKMHA